MTTAHINTLKRFINEAINQQQLAVVDDIVHPDYVYRAPGEEMRGREALKALLGTYHTAFPDLQLSIEDIIANDEKVVLQFTLSGTHHGEFMGIPATHKAVSVNGMTCSRLRDGQIIEEWELIDQLSLFQQLELVSMQ